MLVIFLTPVLIRHLWQLKTVVFLNRCLIFVILIESNSIKGTTLAGFRFTYKNLTYTGGTESGNHSSLLHYNNYYDCKSFMHILKVKKLDDLAKLRPHRKVLLTTNTLDYITWFTSDE
jgi:hypothetical protein